MKPYTIDERTPDRLKKVFVHYPCALAVYRNLVLGRPLATEVFICPERAATDHDPLIEFIIGEFVNHGIAAQRADDVVALHSEIYLTSISFTPEENRVYTANLLKQAAAALGSEDSPITGSLKNGFFIGSLSPDELALMIEKVRGAMNEAREKPDGSARAMATFVCNQF